MIKIGILCVLGGLVILLFTYNLLKQWIRSIYLAFQLPGPPALPILGNVLLLKDSTEFLKLADSVINNYGKLFRGWLTIIPVIIVTDPKHLQIILGNSKVSDKNFLYSFMHTFLGNGLITSSGNYWKHHRKYIQPYFQLNNLEIFLPAFSEAAEKMAKNLNGLKTVKITNLINNCIMDILHCSILGLEMDDESIKEKSPYRNGTMVLIERILQPWLLFDLTYKLTNYCKEEKKQKMTLHEFTKKILEQRKIDKEKGCILRTCLLDMLMEISENNPDFTDDDIVNEACTFLLAGQDSVGAATAFTLFYLAKYKDAQEKVLNEIDQVFQNFDVLNISALNEMAYLEQCIKESMRLAPSIPLITRKLSEDIKLDNHVIPVGTNILISPYLTHRLPDYYPNPEQFDPDRFAPNVQHNRNMFAYMPFSAGPRNCIGYKFAMLEMKTVISCLLRKYEISLPPNSELKLHYRVTLRATNGITLQLLPR